MVTIIQQRQKCIGCNYCVEVAPFRWQMSKADGKGCLLESVNQKGFWKVQVNEIERDCNELAAQLCPVKIIKVQ